MPTISIIRDQLFRELGRKYTDEEFDELCFRFGIELDETTERELSGKDTGSDEVVYKIDIPANRHDLLCIEGLSQALNVFLGRVSMPKCKLNKPEKFEEIVIETSTQSIRPYVVGAVLRNVTLDAARYNSFIDLQEKLHHNVCRKRSLVAIGTHDLDTIQGPFIYRALPAQQIKFRALNRDEEFNGAELLEQYKSDAHLKAFVPLVIDSPVIPVIQDSNGVVLSMPPIINSYHSRITLNTRNIFIECTATDHTKALVVLDTLVCLFSRYCEKPFEIESTRVKNSAGEARLYPALESRSMQVEPEKINRLVGVKLKTDEIADLLTKMCLTCQVDNDASLKVEIPPLRHDVLHACDVAEDVAIAYGYNNITETLPTSATFAAQNPLNKLTDQLREQLAQAGFTEALTFALVILIKLNHHLY
nr:EOG090X03QT [Triops cancriformis]